MYTCIYLLHIFILIIHGLFGYYPHNEFTSRAPRFVAFPLQGIVLMPTTIEAVWGGKGREAHEFAVYDQAQVYVEYAVYYRRFKP